MAQDTIHVLTTHASTALRTILLLHVILRVLHAQIHAHLHVLIHAKIRANLHVLIHALIRAMIHVMDLHAVFVLRAIHATRARSVSEISKNPFFLFYFCRLSF